MPAYLHLFPALVCIFAAAIVVPDVTRVIREDITDRRWMQIAGNSLVIAILVGGVVVSAGAVAAWGASW